MGEEIFMLKDFNQEYLGIPCGTEREGIRLCKCQYRDIPLNKKYFYKVIAANCEGEPVISYSPEVEEQELDWLIRNIDFSRIGEQDVPLELQLPGYEVSYMNRMLREKSLPEVEINQCVDYRYLPEYRKYVATQDGELTGYAKVSDVVKGFGNLVVWVDEERRGQGIGTSLVQHLMTKCYEEGIEPMYLVKTSNKASIAVAKKLGFTVAQQELVFTKK